MKLSISRAASDKIRYSYNVAAVLVLIMHCSGNLPVRNNWSYAVCEIIASAGVVGVPWFLFMSAYFLFRNYDGAYNKLLKRKWKSLFIPYIVWNSIGYFFRIVVRNPINGISESFSFKELLKGFVPLQNANGAFWFIALLMLYVLLTPFFRRAIVKKEAGYFIVGTMVFLIAANITSANYWAILFYMPVYLLGGYIALHYSDIFENFIEEDRGLDNQISVAYLVMRFIFGGVIYFSILFAYHRKLISQNIYSYLAPIVFILLMKIKLSHCRSNWLTKNGSFIIYASHGLFTNILCPNIYIFKKWSLSILGGWQNIIPAYTMVVILCMLLVGMVIGVVWLFRDSKWIWVFTGGRN